ncbi:MAG: IS200/IS605 family transposase, partial [Coleofasciculus sp. G3-WIS-01]|uniref:IS200/IS605 family transposase n=1 Tax=Coleofasciculus sp. G3-WIS-01 TaxID=3069528 RepID=UPI0032FB8928
MVKKKRYRSSSRSVSDLKAHLVLTTKYRAKCINAALLEQLETSIRGLCEKWGVTVIEFNGEDDHVHLLFSYYPQMQLSKFINNLKTVNSGKVNKEFSEHLAQFFWKKDDDSKREFWNDSYAIESVGGANIEVLERYIRGQNAPTR